MKKTAKKSINSVKLPFAALAMTTFICGATQSKNVTFLAQINKVSVVKEGKNVERAGNPDDCRTW